MSKIMAELLKVANMKPPKEVDQAFLAKLHRNCETVFDNDDPDEKKWGKLSAEAQKWMNSAATALTKKADIKDFPDADAGSVGEDEPEGDTDVAAKKATTKKATTPAKKAAAPAKKAAAAPAKKKAAPERPAGKSMRRWIKELVIGKPDITVEQLTAKLEAKGFEAGPTTVQSIRSDTRDTLKVAQEMGVTLKSLEL